MSNTKLVVPRVIRFIHENDVSTCCKLSLDCFENTNWYRPWGNFIKTEGAIVEKCDRKQNVFFSKSCLNCDFGLNFSIRNGELYFFLKFSPMFYLSITLSIISKPLFKSVKQQTRV